MTICAFDIRWKHICGQKWKQSIHENKTYKHTKIICFCRPTVHFQPERPFSLNWRFFFGGEGGEVFPKRIFWVEIGKKWTSPLNSAYWNKSRYKISLKLTILIFVPKLLKKGTAGLKQKTRSFACARVRYLLD